MSDTKQPCAEAVQSARRIQREWHERMSLDALYPPTEDVAQIIQSAIDARLAEERKEVEQLLRQIVALEKRETELRGGFWRQDMMATIVRAEALLARWRSQGGRP